MVRFLERNGYNASYSTDIDTDRRGAEILEHKAFLSVGHDEYWSGNQRANVEAARAAGRAPRVLQRQRGVLEDPLRAEHRRHRHAQPDARHLQGDARKRQDRSPPGRLDGHLARPTLQPAGRRRPPGERADGADLRGQQRRHERDQGPGRRRQDAVLAQHDRSPRRRPARPPRCRPARSATSGTSTSTTARARPGHSSSRRPTVTGAPVLQDYGSTYGSATANHNMTMYRAASGARVFGAGTVQWSWGLDANHDRGSTAAEHEHAAGHGQPAGRHGHPAGHAA